MRLYLYIGGSQADLSDDSLVLMNYEQGDLDNPAIVKNSYSQQITLPATSNNDRIFGWMWRNDRITGSGDFNPIKKQSFYILDERGDMLESGYLKLDSVENDHSYKVTLYGGLGELFYYLSYKDDGTAKTLADLYFYSPDNDDYIAATSWAMALSASSVKGYWDAIADGELDTDKGVINFAPCYNGLPDDFDADKMYYKPVLGTDSSMIAGIYTITTPDGGVTYYQPKNGRTGGVLVNYGKDHTEWEVQDLRCYLQRPVLRVKYLLQSLKSALNTGGWTLEYDQLSNFFDSSNPYYEDTWITLPMIDRESVNLSSFHLSDLLKGTGTPASYLIGLAKMFGLVFLVNGSEKTVTMVIRDFPYLIGYADMTDDDKVGSEAPKLIDKESVSIEPTKLSTRNIVYKTEMYGEFAENYEEKYGQVYGAQKVDTGYEFDTGVLDALDGIVFKGAPEVLEQSEGFQIFGGDSTDGTTGAYNNYWDKFQALGDTAKWNLYATVSGEEKSLSCEPNQQFNPVNFLYNGSYSGYDFMSKVQLHGADNKAEDGSNVILFLNGMVDVPEHTQSGVVMAKTYFRLTDDCAEMLSLNDDVPCWCWNPASDVQVTQLPHFGRMKSVTSSGTTKTYMLEMGVPKVLSIPGASLVANSGIYAYGWKSYNEDRYDKDARVMTCKVNLTRLLALCGYGYSAMPEFGVMSAMMFFYFFEGARWVLTKVKDYNPASDDLTECEFVRVLDMGKYAQGQGWW